MTTKPKGDLGTNTMRVDILRAVQRGIQRHSRLMKFESSKYAARIVKSVVEQMVADGALHSFSTGGERHYSITAAGQSQIPSALPMRAWKPLEVAVRAPVRADAHAFRSLPSVAAGQEREWRHPC